MPTRARTALFPPSRQAISAPAGTVALVATRLAVTGGHMAPRPSPPAYWARCTVASAPAARATVATAARSAQGTAEPASAEPGLAAELRVARLIPAGRHPAH